MALLAILMYRRGMGEPDSIYIAAGIYQGILKGTFLSESLLYYPQGHFVYYALLFFGLKNFPPAIETTMTAMNWFTMLSASASLFIVLLALRQHLRPAVAIIGSLFLFASPTVLEWSTFGHPAMPSLLFALIATYLLISYAGATESPMLRVCGSLLALAFYVLAIGSRADIMVFFPGLGLFVAILGDRTLRAVTSAWIIMGAAIIVFWLLALAAEHIWSFQSTASFLDAIARFHESGQVLRIWSEGVVRLVLAAGGITCALAVWGLVLLIRRRNWWLLASALALVAAGFFYSLGYPPSRHLIATIAGIAVLAAVPFATHNRWPRYITAGLGIVVLLANLWLPSFAGLATRKSNVAATPWYFKSWTERHYGNQRYWAWDESRWHDLLVGSWLDETGLIWSLCRDDVPIYRARLADLPEARTFQAATGSYHFLELYPPESWPRAVENLGLKRIVFLSGCRDSLPLQAPVDCSAAPPERLRFVSE